MVRSAVSIDKFSKRVGFNKVIQKLFIEERNHLVNYLYGLDSNALSYIVIIDIKYFRQ
jgi:hypothetical protein